MIVPAFKEMLQQIQDAPFEPESRHCMRPKRIQPDDWECPNVRCGNLCFARRKECPVCKTPKPSEDDGLAPSTSNDVPDALADPQVSRPPKHAMTLISTADRLPRLDRGHRQVVWLVPLENRGSVIGRQGRTAHRIRSQTYVNLVVTREPEVRQIGDSTYCLTFLRGSPEGLKSALSMVSAYAGGRLARDGFQELLAAVEGELLREEQLRLPLAQLLEVEDIRLAMNGVWDLMRICGLRSLMEVLEQWPEYFKVQRTGPYGAEAELLDRLIPEPWSKAPDDPLEQGPEPEDEDWQEEPGDPLDPEL